MAFNLVLSFKNVLNQTYKLTHSVNDYTSDVMFV